MNQRLLCAASGIALSLALASGLRAGSPAADVQQSPVAAFTSAHPESPLYYTDQRITTVYGKAFSHGNSPVDSVGAFVAASAPIFGVAATDLVSGSLAGDGLAVRAFMPDLDDGHLRFTLVSYLQAKDGIPVFRADLRLLVRNEDGWPLVLARSGLRPLGDFVVDANLAAAPNIAGAFEVAGREFPGIAEFSVPQVVIWAGTESVEANPPALAVAFEGVVGAPGADNFDKLLVVADAANGAVLYTESLINYIDVTGTVKGMATPGKKADICATEASTNLPYSRVAIGSTVAFADVNGAFTIPNGGSSAVNVTSGVRGKFFRVYDSAAAGADPEVLTLSVTPPGPANFVHNAANNTATFRSGVNAYLQANVVRDYSLKYCPTYPGLPNQSEWRVNVNVSGTCNAFYDGSSINFYAAGGSCPSTAFGDVVWHEYGHHLVNRAGSGQGQYGEGQADVMGVLISDEPVLGYGFNSNCNSGIRNANNTRQYPQSGEIHDAGQLISGCVWSVRNQLVGPYPSTYKDILGSLAVNAILLHTGDLITPQITIDYLTLDDTNANISDGTPHYNQINAGFTAHNMPGPALAGLSFSFPQGKPSTIPPAGGQVFTVQVSPLSGTPQQNTGVLYVDTTGTGTFATYPMPQLSPNLYGAVFPATTCGNPLAWYVSAKTTTNVVSTSPSDAPAHAYAAVSAEAGSSVAFSDNFQAAAGWTTHNSSGTNIETWKRVVPPTPTTSGPATDFDGSGMCYITTASGTGDPGAGAILGTIQLISPTLDASAADYSVCYARWFSNSTSTNPNTDSMIVEISNDNGTNWVNLETVGPTGPQVAGGWYYKTFRIADTIARTNQMKVRYSLTDVGGASRVVAAVDAFALQYISCPGNCPADFNHDGFLDPLDYNAFINAFESADISADYNGDGFIDPLDYNAFINDFEAGC